MSSMPSSDAFDGGEPGFRYCQIDPLTSPVIIIFVLKPSRVRNIFICCSGVSLRFIEDHECIVERASTQCASGATSMVPSSMKRLSWSAPSMSESASYSGRRYGSTFSFNARKKTKAFSRLDGWSGQG